MTADPFREETGIRAQGARLLLHDLQSPINIGLSLRLAESLASPVSIHDPRGVLARDDAHRTVSDFAVGALQRVGYADCASIETTFGTRGQRPFRLVATAITGATPSPDFVFQPRDVIVVGNEYDGLPDSVIEMCDAAVTIPLAPVQQPKPRSFSPIDPMRPQTVAREGTPSLNVAMAAAILLHAAWLQLSER